MKSDKTIMEYLCEGLDEDEILHLEDGSILIDGNRCYEKWSSVGRKELTFYDLFGTDGILFPDEPEEMRTWKEKGCISLSKEVVHKLSHAVIRLDMSNMSKVKKDFLYASRPYYMVRGKSITPDQVRVVLLSEYPMLRNKKSWDLYCQTDDPGDDMARRDPFGMIFPYKSFLPGANGWLRESGEIGGNIHSSVKFPGFEEIMPLWLRLAVRFPFLDMAIGYTDYNENPCWEYCMLESRSAWSEIMKPWAWEKLSRENEQFRSIMKKYRYYCDEVEAMKSGKRWCPCRGNRIDECELHFSRGETDIPHSKQEFYDYNYHRFVNLDEIADDVCMTVQIKDGNLSILFGEEAVQTYKEYAEKYIFEDPRRYSDLWNELTQEPYISETFLRDLVSRQGLDDDICIDFLEKKVCSWNS